jgi:hypothetical protein
MSLVDYDGDSSDDHDDDDNNNNDTDKHETSSVVRRLHLPAPSHISTKNVANNDENDERLTEAIGDKSSSLLANLPKPHETLSTHRNPTTMELPEGELEDMVRIENKEYAKSLPQLPKSSKRKRDGPVKIFLPSIEQVGLER